MIIADVGDGPLCAAWSLSGCGVQARAPSYSDMPPVVDVAEIVSVWRRYRQESRRVDGMYQ